MADDAVMGGDITDLSNSAAYVALEELLEKGHLTQAQVDLYKSKYAKLHEVVLQTYENEKNLLKNAKALNQEAMAEQVKLKKTVARSADNKETINTLRNELSKGESEAAVCEEREAMMQLEIAELKRQMQEAEREKEAKEQELAEKMAPRINAAKGEVEALEADLAKDKELSDALTSQQQSLENQIKELEETIKRLELEKEDERKKVVRIKNEPVKARKQCDLVEIALKGIQNDYDSLQKMLEAVDMALDQQRRKRKVMEDDKEEIFKSMDSIRAQLDQKERHWEALQSKKNAEHEVEKNYVQRRLEVELAAKASTTEHKRVVEVLHRSQRERDDASRKYRATEFQFNNVQGTLPLLQSQLQEAARRLDSAKAVKKQKEAQIDELNKDLDIFINTFLNAEQVEKDKADALSTLLSQNKTLENELARCAKQELELAKELSNLSSKRDAKARELSKALSNVKDAHEELQVKGLITMDLTKKNGEIAQQLKEFSALYEVVKNERNKYVNLIQSATQALAEMKEKIGILQNEIDILRNENLAKEKALSKEKSEHQVALQNRDTLRIDANKHANQYKEKQEEVDQQIAEIDKLNSIINNIEREMLRLKRQYEVAVEQRNYTGIQLIDRNDELCILYEKSNIQDDVLRNGHIEFRERSKELRWLKLIHSDLLREVSVSRKLLPKIQEYKREMNALNAELNDERLRSEKLSHDLETPTNKKRWRALEGKDLEPDELATKVRELDERLNDKKEIMLEKELVLEEVSSLSDRLRKQAADGREDTLELANKVNEFQNRIRSITRKMMATVSELSMYQASAIKLNTERQYLGEELQDARTRMEKGEAPTEDADIEWQRMERDRLTRLEYQRSSHAEAVQDESASAVSTAEARPNAYIPDDIGIPKPYGGMAPFKPSEPGSSMRHIVKPQPREIQI